MSENFKNLEEGKTFKAGNRNLKVQLAETTKSCKGCVFGGCNTECCLLQEMGIIPECDSVYRTDNKSVVFVEVQNEYKKRKIRRVQNRYRPKSSNVIRV